MAEPKKMNVIFELGSVGHTANPLLQVLENIIDFVNEGWQIRSADLNERGGGPSLEMKLFLVKEAKKE